MSDVMIDGMTEAEVWEEYKKTNSPKLRDAIIVQYAPLVKYVAGKLAVSMPSNVDFDDLVGYGTFGLIDAVGKYNPGKDVKFKTYAVTRIRGSIFDELRSMDWIPRSVRQKAKEVDLTVQILESDLGRAATEDEIADYMNLSVDELRRTMVKISGTSLLSLNELWSTGNDNDKVSIQDSIESPSALQPDVMVEKEEIKRVISEAITELPDNEKKVLVLYYYEDLTLKEIGSILDVTESRVSQLHTRAIVRLRGKLTNIKKGLY
ncbi:MAG: RNA polymerase sigma factor WhiG [Spirochaetales bacterium]|nr:RNA polymerase sigma factor WhiG [Spirochaetales bacterium]